MLSVMTCNPRHASNISLSKNIRLVLEHISGQSRSSRTHLKLKNVLHQVLTSVQLVLESIHLQRIWKQFHAYFHFLNIKMVAKYPNNYQDSHLCRKVDISIGLEHMSFINVAYLLTARIPYWFHTHLGRAFCQYSGFSQHPKTPAHLQFCFIMLILLVRVCLLPSKWSIYTWLPHNGALCVQRVGYCSCFRSPS